MQIGDEVRATLTGGVFTRGAISDLRPDSVRVRDRWFPLSGVQLLEDIERAAHDAKIAAIAAHEAQCTADREALQTRQKAFREDFQNRIPRTEGFHLALISNLALLTSAIEWHNANSNQTINTETPFVYGYAPSSKGGVQYQGRCTSEDVADYLQTFGFEIIARGKSFEINGSDLWRELIEAGVAVVGANYQFLNPSKELPLAAQDGLSSNVKPETSHWMN